MSNTNNNFYVARHLLKRAVQPNRLLRPAQRFGGQVSESSLRSILQVMVWAGFGYSDKLSLVVWPANETVNADTYSERVIGNVVQPFLDEHDVHRRRFTLQEDGARAHWARRTQEAKAEGGIASLRPGEWAAASPDLAPADYFLWGWMCKEVCWCSQFLIKIF